MPIPLLFALGAGGTAAGAAALGGIGSARAAATQDRAVGRAMDLQRDIYGQQQANYQQSRQDMAPWMQAGQASLADLMRQSQAGAFDTPYQAFDMNSVQADPGFQFRLEQGQKALERSAAARGSLMSGGFMKSLGRYSQGLASDEYQNAYSRSYGRHRDEYAARQGENAGRFGRLSSLAGMGQGAAQYLGNLGQAHSGTMSGYANSMSQLEGARGNAQAAGARAPWDAAAGGINAFNENLWRGVGMMGGMGGGGGGGLSSMMMPRQGGGGGSTGYTGGYIPNAGFGLNYGNGGF